MKKLAAAVIALALLVPGAAFAGSSTDAALGLGAFAVFNQIISGTGIFGGLHHAPQPVVVHQPVVQERVIIREYHPVYVQPQPYYVPVYHAPVYYAPAHTQVVVVKKHHHGHGHYKKHHGHYYYKD